MGNVLVLCDVLLWHVYRKRIESVTMLGISSLFPSFSMEGKSFPRIELFFRKSTNCTNVMFFHHQIVPNLKNAIEIEWVLRIECKSSVKFPGFSKIIPFYPKQ